MIINVSFTLNQPSIQYKTDRHSLSLKVQNSRGYEVQARRQNDVSLNTVVMEVGLAKESIKSVQACVGLLLSGNKPFIEGIYPYNIPSVCIVYPSEKRSVNGDEHLSGSTFKMCVSCRGNNNTTRNVLRDRSFSMDFVDGVSFELALLNA